MRAIARYLVVILAAGGLLAGPAAAQSPHTHHHSFGDAQKWSKIFDDPKRDAWQKPHEVIQALKLKPDSVVADIGAGTGYFAARFAHMVLAALCEGALLIGRAENPKEERERVGRSVSALLNGLRRR